MNGETMRLFDPAAEAPPQAPAPRPESARLTAEQSLAVQRREGSLLVSANAGSGKTSVLVERFVAAVLEDGVAPGRVLAITFTERAAGELRERIRERLLAAGAREAARDTEAAFVLTIHGFCARLLRSAPWAAGLDPSFSVLDDRAAHALRQSAFEKALASFLGAREDGPELDLLAAWGLPRVTATILAVHERLRSRGMGDPRLPPIPLTPDPGERRRELEGARARLAGELASCSEPSARIIEALAMLERCGELLRSVTEASAPGPALAALAETRLAAGSSAALQSGAAQAYTRAWDAYRSACADRHGAQLVRLLAGLLREYAASYSDAKRGRAAVDFDDLELAARDLLRDPGRRSAWAERFELVMVDEFQDTNPRQLEIIEALERENLFCVGDEFQSIYAFRHADVSLFRARRAQLAARGATAKLARNFRGRSPLLDAINAVFVPILGDAFVALEAGRREDQESDGPLVELMITDVPGWSGEEAPDLGATLPQTPRWRQAEARLAAQRIDDLISAGEARPGDIALLVRAAGDMAVYERALEDRGLPTLAAGGRGYWSRQQVQDLTAALAVVANPLDERALYGVLGSPLGGLSRDGLAELALASRGSSRGVWALIESWASGHGLGGDAPAGTAPAHLELSSGDRQCLKRFVERLARHRRDAPRLSLVALLDCIVRDAGYDHHVRGLRGGERRLANVHKLMRLAGDFEAEHGRQLRGFLEYVGAEEGRQAREADAPVQDGGPEAVRLMTIHAAKGLEFPVVCLADLGRAGRVSTPWLLVEGERVGVRTLALEGGDPVDALDYAELRRAQLDAEHEEERRIIYVAMTRARDRLLLSGAADPGRLPSDRPGAPPIGWIARALLPDLSTHLFASSPIQELSHESAGYRAHVRVSLSSPKTVGRILRPESLAPGNGARSSPMAGPPGPQPTIAGAGRLKTDDAGRRPGREGAGGSAGAHRLPSLSYSALAAYARCGYRFYVQRVLGLPDAAPPADERSDARASSARMRGVVVHALLESLDFARPVTPPVRRVRSVAEALGWSPDADEAMAIAELIAAFAASALCARLANARSVRREHPFAMTLAGAQGQLLTGVVDVLAEEPGGDTLIVDYKSDALAGRAPESLAGDEYGVQRSVYALAALRAGRTGVEVAHCFLERPHEPVSARFGPDDSEALAARLRSLADGVSSGRFPVAREPHRELCLTCPARQRLCSWAEDMTLRTISPDATLRASDRD